MDCLARLPDRASGPSFSRGLEGGNVLLQDLMHTHQMSSQTGPMTVLALALGTGESVVRVHDTSGRGFVNHSFFRGQLVCPLKMLAEAVPLGELARTCRTG